MPYTEFRIDPASLSQAAIETAMAVKANQPDVEPVGFAAQIVIARLTANPTRYLEFGPYWWAVKRALRRLGHDLGPNDDAVIVTAYGGELIPYAALVAGERFRALYLRTFFAGNAQFNLDLDGDSPYVLFDQDMANRARGVLAPLDAIDPDPSDGLLDGVPTDQPDEAAGWMAYRVDIEWDACLWSIDVYAQDQDRANAMVKHMEASGRIGRAIDLARAIGESVVPNEDYEDALYVDLPSRRIVQVRAI